MLLLHWPNWRKFEDTVIPKALTWIEKFEDFMESEDCPNFERAKPTNSDNQNEVSDSDDDNEYVSQPE